MKYLSYISTPIVLLGRKNARIITKKINHSDLYTGKNLNDKIWTLEHVVPQSRVSNDGKKNDLHNLAGIESKLNSSRGNKKFGDCMYDYKLYEECKLSKKLFEPHFGKGDVARICAYMLETYGDSIDEDNLIDKETLLRWNYENPPCDKEKRKNELIYEVQGNYNRFIDDHNFIV